jgi:hypothetical protein
MTRWILPLLAIFYLLGPLAPVQSDLPPTFSNTRITYQFGEQAVFETTVQSSLPVDELLLSLQANGMETRLEEVPVNAFGEAVFQYDLRQTYLPPFAAINVWFTAILQDGSQVESETFQFIYEDNRYSWNTLESPPFLIKWQNGNAQVGQTILDTAQNGLKAAQAVLPVQTPVQIRLYVYEEAAELQNALTLGQISNQWTAGSANPVQNVILISAPEGANQQLELERQIPHELVHILMANLLGEKTTRIPSWLSEGLASQAELNPNPDYERALQQAVDSNSLLSMESLCRGFPTDASGAFLAYAQSESFTRFISQKYGDPSIRRLVQVYQDGMDCQQGSLSALGVSLQQVELDWRDQALAENIGLTAWNGLAPYAILLAIVIFPAFLSLLFRPNSKRSRIKQVSK